MVDWQRWLARLWPMGKKKLSQTSTTKRRGVRLGLALGGGGIRGGAHIGVLKCLIDHGVAPDLLAGTSAGSIVAVLYGIGLDPEDIVSRLTEIDKRAIFDLSVSKIRLVPLGSRLMLEVLGLVNPRKRGRVPLGIIKGEEFQKWLQSTVGDNDFEDLRVPTYVVATDIHDAATVVMGTDPLGEGQLPSDLVFLPGVPIAEAVRASISIPLLFEPKVVSGRTLVDGVITEPVPAGVLRAAGADVVIAVDLGMGGPTSSSYEGMLDVYNRSIAISGQKYTELRLARHADLVIRPHMTSARLTDVELIPDFVDWGYQAAEKAFPKIAKLLRGEGEKRPSGAPEGLRV